jgi:hypothetical protein
MKHPVLPRGSYSRTRHTRYLARFALSGGPGPCSTPIGSPRWSPRVRGDTSRCPARDGLWALTRALAACGAANPKQSTLPPRGPSLSVATPT